MMKTIKPFLLLLSFSLFFGFESEWLNDHQIEAQLIVFEGSDWCVNCRKFEQQILQDSNFVEFLQTQQIQVEKIDFPQRKKLSKSQQNYNATMADKYAFDGNFPTLILARIDTLKFEKLYYLNQSTTEMIDQIQDKIKRLQ